MAKKPTPAAITIAKIDDFLSRVKAYSDSAEVAREVGAIGDYLAEHGYWPKEAQTHILGLWAEARTAMRLLRQYRRHLQDLSTISELFEDREWPK